ncbi:MAG: type II toxin-antitoxin system MqsA family antitoxin [Rhodocyclaceae bacterium]|nr:type II toxin-antitoxin system MqsA family antitoxin [Rhodocyclaceae bacterium]
MSKEQHFCLQCDDGTLLKHGRKDKVITIDDLSATVPAVFGWHCPVCGECEFDEGEGKRFSAALAALRKSVNEKRQTEMRAVRKKLGLRQADAGRIFGGGASAFSEYERGKTQPHKSTVLLLRLLDRHPELLQEVMS